MHTSQDSNKSLLATMESRSDATTPRESLGCGSDEGAFRQALELVCSRYLNHIEDIQPSDILFQIEQGWWYYEDCIVKNDDRLSHLSLKSFCCHIFQELPALCKLDFESMWHDFCCRKRATPTYGTILLNEDCSKVVLCQVWNSKSWTFPAGKSEPQDEQGLQTAARETWEETGFDPNCQYGVTKCMKQSGRIPWDPLQEQHRLSFNEQDGKRRTCYICPNVPEDFPFRPVCRNEIGKVEWHPLNDIPKSYAVLPLLKPLKRWIQKHRGQSSWQRHRRPQTYRSPCRWDGASKRRLSPRFHNDKLKHHDNVAARSERRSGPITRFDMAEEPVPRNKSRYLRSLLHVEADEGVSASQVQQRRVPTTSTPSWRSSSAAVVVSPERFPTRPSVSPDGQKDAMAASLLRMLHSKPEERFARSVMAS